MTTKKDALVKTATELFAKDGYTAVGIDRIIEEAGVAKMTLYKYFPSKADLILEVLVQRDTFFRNSLMAACEKESTVPAKIFALFEWHDQWFKRRDFNGCMFINAAGEFHNRKDPIHKMSSLHKQLIKDYIEGILRDTYGSQAARLASKINIILDGAIDAAHVIGSSESTTEGWEIAKCLLEQTEKAA